MNKIDITFDEYKKEFCALILTHGRPNNVKTLKALEKSGYSGDYFIVIDNEDKTADQYIEKFGDRVVIFNKEQVAKTFDNGDNFNDRRPIICNSYYNSIPIKETPTPNYSNGYWAVTLVSKV